MDTTSLIHLIETVSKTLNAEGFEHIDLSHEGTTLTLNKKSVASVGSGSQVAVQQAAPVVAAAPSVSIPTDQATKRPTEELIPELPDEDNFSFIESPIVGTFYDAPSPEAETFVKVGDQVKKGQVVCIIEAMKLMNEIEAETEGEIVEIMVSNEGPVEYGQPLYKLK